MTPEPSPGGQDAASDRGTTDPDPPSSDVGADSDLATTVGHLAQALAAVRTETGTEAIELRGRFRTIEQRLATIEDQQTRIVSLLEERLPRSSEPRKVKSSFTADELERIRRSKRQERAARDAIAGKGRPARAGANREQEKPSAKKRSQPAARAAVAGPPEGSKGSPQGAIKAGSGAKDSKRTPSRTKKAPRRPKSSKKSL